MSSADEAKRGPDRVAVNTSVAVRSEAGFYFGTLRWIEPTRVLVEIDAPLEDGEPLDVRITLSPTTATALFRGNVGRALVTATGEAPRYILLIREFVSEDADRFKVWLQNVRSRGTFSNFDTVVSSHSPESNRASHDVRQALERLARKPVGGSAGPATDPFGVRSDLVTNGGPGAGRGAVRDALRSAIARTGAGRPGAAGPGRVVASAPPVSPATPPRLGPAGTPSPPGGSGGPPSSRDSYGPNSYGPNSYGPNSYGPGVVRIGGNRSDVTPVDARSQPPRLSEPPPRSSPGATVRDPTYATTSTKSATWMEVRWTEPEAFARDARLQLCNYILVLQRAVDPLPDREPLRVMIRHADLQIECAGAIKAVGPNGATYRLDLDALQVERLRTWIAEHARR